MKFTTKIIQSGNNTGIEIPPAIIEAFGAGKKPPVKITLNNYSYRNTVAVMGGVYMVGLSKEHRQNANVVGGQELEIDIELDTAPRTVELPADFQAALDLQAGAQAKFDALAPSRKKFWVVNINEAKTEATRSNRIAKAVTAILEGKG